MAAHRRRRPAGRRPDRVRARSEAPPRRRDRLTRHQGGRRAHRAVTTETAALAGVEPRACWRHFEALTRIARPSRHEEAVIEHVREWAAERGFEFRQDAARNLVVRVPASTGRESASVLVLQGHLDMVCERLPNSSYDPAEGEGLRSFATAIG